MAGTSATTGSWGGRQRAGYKLLAHDSHWQKPTLSGRLLAAHE